ncbi:unnamed protein product [Lactuca virosa]|uniref:Uncharacterized protein n=1 Tax=Lactuca virosa TaxID=75947 RepID=A0AAU9LL46_9ASTR|nr:unnamed protein product [Lactuca virosa]
MQPVSLELYFKKNRYQNIDWCSYVLDCLVRTKNSYIPYSYTSFFVGPSAFLVLFYADNIHSEALTVTRKRPTICYWSSEKIRYRETFEQEKGRFGLGELNEEFVNEQDEGDTDLEDSDSDKDEDHSVEAYESKISKMLNSFERMKEKLNSKLNDAITKFPEKERINLTPIIGQKTNDQKENEDKEGNGEEDNDNDGSQPEEDYLLDSNEAENEGIKNDGDNNQKEGETEVKEKDGKNNQNDNDEEKKVMIMKKQIIMKRLFNKLKMKICWIKLLTTLWIMSLELEFQV